MYDTQFFDTGPKGGTKQNATHSEKREIHCRSLRRQLPTQNTELRRDVTEPYPVGGEPVLDPRQRTPDLCVNVNHDSRKQRMTQYETTYA